jgi:hypothetical protein
MKFIFSLVIIYTLFSCAAPKAPVTKSVETKKKEAFKNVKPVNKSLPNPRIPNASESTSPENPSNKSNDAKEF